MKLSMIICFGAALVFFLFYLYWGNQMDRGRKRDVDAPNGKALSNRLNISVYPSLLTEEGLRARRWFFLFLVCFLGCLVAGILVAVF
jgi:hypothetical protein